MRKGDGIGKSRIGRGFRLRAEATLSTAEEVGSSIAPHLGMDFGATTAGGREVERVVGMMLDATQRYAEPLTAEHRFAWHACLFPIGPQRDAQNHLRRVASGGRGAAALATGKWLFPKGKICYKPNLSAFTLIRGGVDPQVWTSILTA